MIKKFLEKPSLGGDDLRASFQLKIEDGIEQRLSAFKAENNRKRVSFIVSLEFIPQFNF